MRRENLGLTDHQMEPTRRSLRLGNLISAAVPHALHLIGTDPDLRPRPGGPGLGAGFGPGFASTAFAWQYHNPGGTVWS